MKKLVFLTLLFVSALAVAQPHFVVQNRTSKVFNNINTAIAAANAGDTLYIPGGGFSISAAVDKTMHWIGVGHYPDSTPATGPTKIVSPVYFSGNSDNSSFEGIDFTSNFEIGSSNNELENLVMKRCRVRGTLFLRAATTGNPNINAQISECVLYDVDGRNASNCHFEKCIINYMINNFNQSFFDFNYCNLINPSWWNTITLNSIKNSLFTNNVFSVEYSLNNVESCVFSYNLYAGGLPFDPVISTNTGKNNIINVGDVNIYTTITTSNQDFQYANNYRLKAGCPGIGAADDGTDIGIFGSSLPYKEGAVPSYPHVTSAKIDRKAIDGKVGVKITVTAQER